MRILVVDPNEAFATLLQEELQRHQYEVLRASGPSDALACARSARLDLALIDMAVEDPGAVVLGQGLRQLHPGLRLVLIPIMGETILPDVAASLAVQGVLPKPFFLPELPERIETALRVPFSDADFAAPDSPEAAVVTAAPVIGASSISSPVSVGGLDPRSDNEFRLRSLVEQHRAVIERIMSGLAQETGADAVVLTLGDVMVAWTGTLGKNDAEGMAKAVVQGWITSAQVARILGREQIRFEQSIADADYMLYARSVNPLMIVAVALRGGHALGLLRHQARAAAEEIASLCAA